LGAIDDVEVPDEHRNIYLMPSSEFEELDDEDDT
jgi:hypothetical protein